MKAAKELGLQQVTTGRVSNESSRVLAGFGLGSLRNYPSSDSGSSSSSSSSSLVWLSLDSAR